MTNRNPLQRYNDANAEYSRRNNMAVSGLADWEHANPRPGMDADMTALDEWMWAYDQAEIDIRADLDVDGAMDELIAAEKGLVGWLAAEIAPVLAANNDADSRLVADMLDRRHHNVGIRRRLVPIALRYARGRLRG